MAIVAPLLTVTLPEFVPKMYWLVAVVVTPLFKMVSPVYVLAPVRLSVPPPALVKLPGPLIMLDWLSAPAVTPMVALAFRAMVPDRALTPSTFSTAPLPVGPLP